MLVKSVNRWFCLIALLILGIGGSADNMGRAPNPDLNMSDGMPRRTQPPAGCVALKSMMESGSEAHSTQQCSRT
jgi:hypothetical protein